MAIGVLVPHAEGLAALSGVPGVQVARYDAEALLPAAAATAEVLVPPILGSVRTDLRAELPALRLVQLLTAGAEDWVGRLPAGVALSDCRGAHGGATAEWAAAVILAVYRELPAFVRAQDAGEWAWRVTPELAGARVLIVGAGDVAEQVARRLAAFDVRLTMVGRLARDGVHALGELPDLLPRHDVVVLAVPLTAATRGLVDAAFLAAMPDGALLVNAARGPVVDTRALTAELAAGRLRAALDVTDPEPLPADHPLWSAPNLLLTPHVAGSVPGALHRAYAVAAEQIAAYARGDPPPNLVTDGY